MVMVLAYDYWNPPSGKSVREMSDEETMSPIPWGLVEHVKRTKSGRTTLQISLPIELRARLHQASIDLGCSKLALIRSAISQFLLAHEKARSIGQERAYAATSEVLPPVPGPVPAVEGESNRAAGEPEPELPPVIDEPRLVPAISEQTPTPKKSRARKGKAQ